VTASQVSLEKQVGELLWLDADSLVLEGQRLGNDATGPSPVRWVVPIGLLSELEVSQGVHANPDGGFLLGSAIGFGLGALLFGPACFDKYYRDICFIGLTTTTAGFSLLGFVFGGLSRTERWIAAPVPP
jgi:hypothetical protein